jgi:diguanylate cyclase (GGDEF)-like protein
MGTEEKNKKLVTQKNAVNSEDVTDTALLEHTMQYEKRIYDLEQLLDIAKSLCSTLDFRNLLESIVYICMAQMHVLGAEIFIRDFITEKSFYLETSHEKDSDNSDNKVSISGESPIIEKMGDLKKPVTLKELKKEVGKCEDFAILEALSPTLIVPLVLQGHLNGLLILQERIAIEDDTTYNEYEQKQIMLLASLASVAIYNASLLEMSSTDMMTHLKLKYYFYSRLSTTLDRAVDKKQKISVLMFDIDFFKKFNDTYGHECGDFVLISVAELIKKSLRDTDIACRYGGEEFTVLLTNTGKKEALMVAERIRTTIENNDFVYEDKHFKVTISGGVSVFDGSKHAMISPNAFVNQADKALYVSKNKGRNRVSFYSGFRKKRQ